MAPARRPIGPEPEPAPERRLTQQDADRVMALLPGGAHRRVDATHVVPPRGAGDALAGAAER